MDRSEWPSDGPSPCAAAAPDVVAAVRLGQQIHDSRVRWRGPDARDRWSLRLGALGFVISAGALAAVTDWGSFRPAVFGLAIAALAVASTIELEVGSASAVPTEPVVVAMLLMLPAGAVPIAVVVAMVAGNLYARVRRQRREPLAVAACSSFFVIGPAAVVQVVGLGPAGPRWWAVIAVAFVAQVVSDLAISWWRNCFGLGLDLSELTGMLRWSYSVDVLLVPVGVTAVLATHGAPVALLLALCPAGLIAFLARDRSEHIDTLISLGSAYSDASDQARRDALSGLGNRLAWDEALASQVAAGREPTGVLMLDVDHLKEINDRYGHELGDRLLVSVADVIRQVLPARGLACRLGGDEFGILIVGATPAELEQLADEVEDGLAQHPQIGDRPISASAGFATAPGGQVLQAARDADRAMYRTKQARRAATPSTVISLIDPLDPLEEAI